MDRKAGFSFIVYTELPCGDLPSTGLGRGAATFLSPYLPPWTTLQLAQQAGLLSSWLALPPRSPNVICLPLSLSHPWGPGMSPLSKERSWNSALGIG